MKHFARLLNGWFQQINKKLTGLKTQHFNMQDIPKCKLQKTAVVVTTTLNSWKLSKHFARLLNGLFQLINKKLTGLKTKLLNMPNMTKCKLWKIGFEVSMTGFIYLSI
jgi:hypothetical protein